MFHIKKWENIRFPEGQIYEDVAIWYKILFTEDNIGLVKEVLYYYYINQAGTVRKDWTPAKLAQIKAWEDQISFFISNGNKNLLNYATMHLFQILQLHLYKISKSESVSWLEKYKYESFVRQKLRKAIFRFGGTPYYKQKKLSILSSAFPQSMWLYCAFLGKVKKFLNVLKKRKN